MVLLRMRQSPALPLHDSSVGGGGAGVDGAGDNERLMQLLRKLWAQTDALFDTTIGAESMLERPIALRNPFLFCT